MSEVTQKQSDAPSPINILTRVTTDNQIGPQGGLGVVNKPGRPGLTFCCRTVCITILYPHAPCSHLAA